MIGIMIVFVNYMLLIVLPTRSADLSFIKKIIDIGKKYDIWIIHDLAYADIVFDGYKAPSILEVEGAKDIAVEFFTLSKSYNMPGWNSPIAKKRIT